MRRSAAYAVGCLGADAAAMRTDVEHVLTDKRPEVRQSAAWALGRLGDASIPALHAALRDGDPLVLRDAAQSLSQLDPKAGRVAVNDLARLANHPDVEVRKAALFGLVGVVRPADAKSNAIVGPLTKGLLDGDLEIRQNAAFALCNIGGAAATPAVDVLAEGLRTGELDLKRQAAAALGNIGAPAKRALPDLIAALYAPDAELRINAALALGSFGEEAGQAVDPLVAIVFNRNDSDVVRAQAATALSLIGPVPPAVKAVPKLLAVASDAGDDGKVRERVMWALRVHNIDLRDMPDVLPAFRKIMTERPTAENHMVRQDCAYLTSMIFRTKSPPEVFPVLLDYLKDESIQVYRKTATLVGGAAQETTAGKTASRELGEGDGRKLAIDALTAIGPALVKKHPEIIEQVRRLAESDRTVASFRQQCREFLKVMER